LNVILEWFDGKDHATKAIKDNFIINEELVEQRPELVSSSCVYSLVNIEIIRKRCTNEAWKATEIVYGEKRRNSIYICNSKHELHITLASFVSASRVHVSHMYIEFLLFSP
jgi:hypothetical protein